MEFGKNIKNLREDNDMTQNQLAKLLNVSRQSISQYESNVATPSIEILIQISDIFNVTLDYLVGRTNENYMFNNVCDGNLDLIKELFVLLNKYKK